MLSRGTDASDSNGRDRDQDGDGDGHDLPGGQPMLPEALASLVRRRLRPAPAAQLPAPEQHGVAH
jgi:hypothetical protein